jgi:hypothetical protein
MHTSITRVQNAFGFFTTVAFVVALFVAGSDYLVARTPGAEVKVGSGGISVYVFPFLQNAPVVYPISCCFVSLGLGWRGAERGGESGWANGRMGE